MVFNEHGNTLNAFIFGAIMVGVRWCFMIWKCHYPPENHRRNAHPFFPTSSPQRRFEAVARCDSDNFNVATSPTSSTQQHLSSYTVHRTSLPLLPPNPHLYHNEDQRHNIFHLTQCARCYTPHPHPLSVFRLGEPPAVKFTRKIGNPKHVQYTYIYICVWYII